MAVKKAFIVENGKTRLVLNPHLEKDVHPAVKWHFDRHGHRHKPFFVADEGNLIKQHKYRAIQAHTAMKIRRKERLTAFLLGAAFCGVVAGLLYFLK